VARCFRRFQKSKWKLNRSALLLAAALPQIALILAQPAGAQVANTNAQQPIETVTVIGTTPIPGIGIDIDKIAGNVQTVTASDLTREGSASATSALNDQLGSVSINDNLDDPFQPDILFRGFEASPVLGTPEGLAVYQNGVRINEAFGDSLNWDLITDMAVDRITVVSANPVYGLNALGGAVIVSMKNGFTSDGSEIEASVGSWGQRASRRNMAAATGRSDSTSPGDCCRKPAGASSPPIRSNSSMRI
jgi:iron complex outermembrane recepter protein